MVFIYVLICPIKKEIRYVGKTENLGKRLREHINQKSNTHRFKWINSLKKEGLEPSIEILDEVDSTEWKFWERFYIGLFKSWCINLVNATNGGDGIDGFKHSIESRMLMSEKQKGRIVKPETRLKISNSMKGRIPANAHKLVEYSRNRVWKQSSLEKLSLASMGNKNMLGKHHSQKTKDIISKTHKGQKLSPERVNKMRDHIINYRKKPVLQYSLDGDFIKRWDGPIYIQRALGFASSLIVSCCNGKQKKSKGFIWKYEK